MQRLLSCGSAYGGYTRTLGRQYGFADRDTGTYDSSGDCGKQCGFYAVSSGKINICRGFFLGISHHWKNSGRRRFGAGKNICQKTAEIISGNRYIVAGLLFFLRVPFLSLYDLQPETMEMTNTFLLIFCVVVMGMYYQMPTNNGIIRGGGNAMFVVKMDLISIWLIVNYCIFFYGFCGGGIFSGGILLFKCRPDYLNAFRHF